MLSPLGIRKLYRLYAQAPVRFEYVHAHQMGMKRIRHFGLFKASAAERLWPRTLEWLQA